ncbi:prolipoprotein diacylglyceryl transferase family protein [Fictibacillus sp. Mic-4]|uniref:prolipoprotein diacylglyceryl transferase n=1 Tax=Fictibacillus sp. Mic-4 TaxID=3132826 RepID=UPI003CEF1B3B
MDFPVWIHLGPIKLHPHFVFETLSYFVGFRLYLRFRRPGLMPASVAWSVITGAILGAALGSKILAWFYDPSILLAHVSHPLSSAAFWLEGKTIVGGLLGGLIGVEAAKKHANYHSSTGDDIVLPLIFGMAIGRIGCFLTGLRDNTYGNATMLPWGIDFGDGINRHPTQAYEFVFLVLLGWFLFILRKVPHQEGDLFKLFMIAYFVFRFVIDFIKPYPRDYFGLGSIQIACLFGLLYYFKFVPQLVHLVKKSNERGFTNAK